MLPKSTKQVCGEFSNPLNYYIRTQGSRPRLKLRLQFWIAVWPLAKHFPSLGLLYFTCSKVAGSSSELQFCSPETSQSKEHPVSYHHACSGCFKLLTLQEQLQSPLSAMFLEEPLWRGLALISRDKLLDHKVCLYSANCLWECSEERGLGRCEGWYKTSHTLPPTSAPTPKTHSRICQHLLSLPRKWFEGMAKVLLSLYYQRERIRKWVSPPPQVSGQTVQLILELSLHIGCPNQFKFQVHFK